MARAPSEQELRTGLAGLICVDHTRLARAKEAAVKLVLEGSVTTGGALVDLIVKDLDAREPPKLAIHPTEEFEVSQPFVVAPSSFSQLAPVPRGQDA